ncbi:hypothetical protein ACFU6K_07100 [Kitasatospora sp. NPDC057512]|uniref:hypothetical protein n=1 Tax=Kitasatospora sp. NPDC057512 TaxID=3346154 RepID=UPI0036ADFA72
MNKIKAAVAVAAALAGIGLAAAPASAAITSPAHCGSTIFGGDFLCGGDYGVGGQAFHTFQDGTQQVFVVGTDHAMWTRWTIGNSSNLSAWTRMGGSLVSRITIVSSNQSGALTPSARGADGYQQYIDRNSGGGWSGWYTYGVPKG